MHLQESFFKYLIILKQMKLLYIIKNYNTLSFNI